MWIRCGMCSVDAIKVVKSFRSLAYQSIVELALSVSGILCICVGNCVRCLCNLFVKVSMVVSIMSGNNNLCVHLCRQLSEVFVQLVCERFNGCFIMSGVWKELVLV